MILERLAEMLPWRLMLLNTGSLRGRVYLEDGVADLAAVSSFDACSRSRRNDDNKGLPERAGPDLQGRRGNV